MFALEIPSPKSRRVLYILYFIMYLLGGKLSNLLHNE